MPDSVASFVDGRHPAALPRGRFWLWMEVACERLIRDGEPGQHFVADMQVYRLYRAVVPWLAYGMGDPAAIQRATDLVCLLDELMENEDELYRYCVAWPMSEVLAVLND